MYKRIKELAKAYLIAEKENHPGYYYNKPTADFSTVMHYIYGYCSSMPIGDAIRIADEIQEELNNGI